MHRFRRLPALCLALSLMFGLGPGLQGADAQTSPVVVEMFTSQGCSACPPAELVFGELAVRDDVIALALHVDYWDYLGWSDVFGSPRNSDRQKRYARANGERMIYTPQLIVGGSDRMKGATRDALLEVIASHAALAKVTPSPVTLRITRNGALLVIQAEADPPLDRPVNVHMVRYLPDASVQIERGENAGRTGRHHNVVTDWTVLTEWAGRAPLTIEAATEGDTPVVVILQEPGPGTVIAAARLR